MFNHFFPDVKLYGTVCSFVIAGTGFWGCDFELLSCFGIRVCLFYDFEHFHYGKPFFIHTFTALIPKDPAGVKMSMDVRKKRGNAIGSTAKYLDTYMQFNYLC